MSARVVLSAGDLEVHLLPRAGGSLVRFDRCSGQQQRQALLRGTDRDDIGPLDAGCFPLVPFANRIRGGSFAFRGRTITLQPNMPPDPSPLHGQGWQAEWDLVMHRPDCAQLSFRHKAGEWPWAYVARLEYALDSQGLSVALGCRNLSQEPMPCGLGLHPYYVCDAETVLDTQVQTVWTVDKDVLPVEQIPAAGRYDLQERRICGQRLDNGYSGWNGRADIAWPAKAARLRLTSPDAHFFQVYSPASGGVFVAEPVQHANAALNAAEAHWAQLGMAVLEHGEERLLHARFAVLIG